MIINFLLTSLVALNSYFTVLTNYYVTFLGTAIYTRHIQNNICYNKNKISTSQTDRFENKFDLVFDSVTCPIPLIKVRIGKSDPLYFALDTGTEAPIILSTNISRRLGIKSLRDDDVVSVSGNPIHRLDIKEITFVGVTPDDSITQNIPVAYSAEPDALKPFLGLPSPDGKIQVAGVVGMPLLKHFVVTMDLSKRKLFLSRVHLIKGTVNAYQIPLIETKKADVLSDSLFYIEVSSGKNKELLLIDTGSNGVSIPSKMASEVSHISHASVIVDEFGRSTKRKLLLLDQFNIGTCRLARCPVSVDTSGGPSVLGTNILALFKVTMDFPNKRMKLEPNIPFPMAALPIYSTAPPLFPRLDGLQFCKLESGPQGIMVAETSEETMLQIISSNKMRFNVGDRVMTIDGIQVKNLTLNAAQHLLNGKSGTEAHVVLRRDNSSIEISYRRRDAFESIDNKPRSDDDGSVVRLEYLTQSKVWLVEHDVEIGEDSISGKEIWLRRGELIMWVNQKKAEDLSKSDMLLLLSAQPLQFVVWTPWLYASRSIQFENDKWRQSL